MRDQQIGDDLLYSLHEKKEHPKSYKAKSGLFKIVKCDSHFDIDCNVLTVNSWSSSGGQNVMIKQAYLKHHHMALPLPWSLKKAEKRV